MSHNKGKGAALKFIRDHIAFTGDDCVMWPFSQNTVNGYGYLGADGKQHAAHRYMCQAAHGPCPTPAHHAAHSCHQRTCINPRHLSWKTLSENMMDKRENGTSRRTNTWGIKGKLAPEQVEKIRELRGKETQAALAGRYGVTEASIRNIYKGKTYTGKVIDWKKINRRGAETRRAKSARALAEAQAVHQRI